MKEILNVIRLDFITASPLAVGANLLILLFSIWFGFFYSPLILIFLTVGAIGFILPLNVAAAKSGFNKFYGILPVSRKNITMGRFLYIFLVFFISQSAAAVLALTAHSLRLCDLLPDSKSTMLEMVRASFDSKNVTLFLIFLISGVVCIISAYLEMMIQIHGDEHLINIIAFTVISIAALFIAGVYLDSNTALHFSGIFDIFYNIPTNTAQFALGINAAELVLCLFFGCIAVLRTSAREL